MIFLACRPRRKFSLSVSLEPFRVEVFRHRMSDLHVALPLPVVVQQVVECVVVESTNVIPVARYVASALIFHFVPPNLELHHGAVDVPAAEFADDERDAFAALSIEAVNDVL